MIEAWPWQHEVEIAYLQDFIEMYKNIRLATRKA